MPTQTELKAAKQRRADAKRNRRPGRIAEMAKNHENARDRNKRVVALAKAHPCVDCGNSYPSVCMDFDHVRGEKWFSISEVMARSEKNLLAEIAKCDLVCANCHRLRTHTDEMKQRNRERLVAHFRAKKALEPEAFSDGA